MVQLHQLAYALAVAEEKSFTQAAARLHLAQPSLSRQVRLLEDELGVLLFNRGPGRGRSPSRLTGQPSCRSCSGSWPTWRPPGPRRGPCRGWPAGGWPWGPLPASSPARAGPRPRGLPRQLPGHRPVGGGGRLAPAGTPGGGRRGRPGPGRAARDRSAGGDHAALRRPPGSRHRARATPSRAGAGSGCAISTGSTW